MPLNPWATIADVKTLTGSTVTQDDLDRALASLGVLIGLIPGVEREDISDRDRYFLKLAACYQAAWLQDNPDLFVGKDVASASQDGESATFRRDAHVLAPLARKAVRRLSWRGLRPVMLGGGSALERGVGGLRDVNSEAFDDSLPWEKM